MADQIYINIKGTHGRVHITEMVDVIENGTSPVKHLRIGDEVNVKVIGFRHPKTWKFLPISHPQSKSMPECSMKPSVLAADKPPADGFLDNVKVGDKVVAYVTSYAKHILWTQVTPSIHGKVYILNMTDDIQNFSPKQFVKRMGYNATVISVLDDTLVELSLCEEKANPQPHTVTRGVVTAVREDKGLVLQLGDGVRGTVGLTDIADRYTDNPTSGYQVDQLVRCYVLERTGKRAVVSLRESRVNNSGEGVDPDIEGIAQLEQDQILRGFVVQCSNTGVLVRLGQGVSGLAKYRHICGGRLQEASSVFPTGKVVTVKATRIDAEKQLVDLSMLNSDTGVSLNIPPHLIVPGRSDLDSSDTSRVKRRKRTSSSSSTSSDKNNSPSKHKRTKTNSEKRQRSSSLVSDGEHLDKASSPKIRKKTTSDTVISDQGFSNNADSDSGVDTSSEPNIKVEDNGTVTRLDVDVGFSWDAEFKLPSTQTGEISSDDSDTEADKKPVKMTKEEMRKARIDEEKKLYEYERQTLEGERAPESADDFDRLVLQSADSSLVWLRYMAFHLATSEIDKARAVAERALKTISFRKEQEKMNVWTAYLNLENMYGTNDTVQKVLSRAIQQTEPVDVYTQMINIYVKSGKMEEAEQLYNKLIKNRKYSGNKDIWLKFGQFYFQTDRLESARKLLQRSLKSLENKYHVETIFKFAQLEFKHGEPERAKTMFENILSTYPRRTDFWSVYIDMVARLKDRDTTRSLFERVINMKFAAKKMKFFFKRYLEFEEHNGDEKSVAEVKNKAMNYVESQGYIDD